MVFSFLIVVLGLAAVSGEFLATLYLIDRLASRTSVLANPLVAVAIMGCFATCQVALIIGLARYRTFAHALVTSSNGSIASSTWAEASNDEPALATKPLFVGD
ncbi:MAG: hypothetical protein HY873_08135 [Chloroflexi bacterium]|nr:hypothetical protein [Chloroflexota bacterium]